MNFSIYTYYSIVLFATSITTYLLLQARINLFHVARLLQQSHKSKSIILLVLSTSQLLGKKLEKLWQHMEKLVNLNLDDLSVDYLFENIRVTIYVLRLPLLSCGSVQDIAS